MLHFGRSWKGSRWSYYFQFLFLVLGEKALFRILFYRIFLKSGIAWAFFLLPKKYIYRNHHKSVPKRVWKKLQLWNGVTHNTSAWRKKTEKQLGRVGLQIDYWILTFLAIILLYSTWTKQSPIIRYITVSCTRIIACPYKLQLNDEFL